MELEKEPNKLFDDMYEAIEYCFNSGYGLNDRWGIYYSKLKKIVTKNLEKDALILLRCINNSGLVECILANEDAITVSSMGIFNLTFFISLERMQKNLLYDYDAYKLFNIYFKFFFEDETTIKLNNLIKNNNMNIQEEAEKIAEKVNSSNKILGVLALVIAVIIGFKISVTMAIITFILLCVIISVVIQFIFLKDKKYVIKSFIKNF